MYDDFKAGRDIQSYAYSPANEVKRVQAVGSAAKKKTTTFMQQSSNKMIDRPAAVVKQPEAKKIEPVPKKSEPVEMSPQKIVEVQTKQEPKREEVKVAEIVPQK